MKNQISRGVQVYGVSRRQRESPMSGHSSAAHSTMQVKVQWVWKLNYEVFQDLLNIKGEGDFSYRHPAWGLNVKLQGW